MVDRGESLAQGAWQLRPASKYRRCCLQTLRRPEGTGCELGEYILEAQLSSQRVDVGVVLPEASGTSLKRFTAGCGHGRIP